MATSARRHYNHAPAVHKTLPISMPAKAPAYHYPVSRIAMSPPEVSDSSTAYYGSRSSGHSYSVGSASYAASRRSDYDSYQSASGVDVADMLSERMNTAFEPMRIDKAVAKQAQTSGQLNAKQRELAELQAVAQRRLRGARQNVSDSVQAAHEARRDMEHIKGKTSTMKAKAAKYDAKAYDKASRRS